MRLTPFFATLLGGLLLYGQSAPDVPSATISNGILKAKLLLPDPERGYYRGTRFDWSGVIASLTYQGHDYYGQWFPKYDPKLHDAIMGPVEEFIGEGETAIGYGDVPVGGTFIRIGVGAVKKPEEAKYRRFGTYDIVDPGKWSVQPKKDSIRFVQTLGDTNGYAYRYEKTIRLVKGKPEMVIEHVLRNTGKKPLDTLQYNHNFFVIDKQPTGPASSVRFGFPAQAKDNFKGLAELKYSQLTYPKELETGQSAASEITGFGSTAKDYDFRVENRTAGVGAHIHGDQPLARVYYWSIRTTTCPEPYVSLHVEPGQEKKWSITYDYYALGGK